jgi:hypothetical protein
MKQHDPKSVQETSKPVYEPPKATLVRLNVEERLMICSKPSAPCYSANRGGS